MCRRVYWRYEPPHHNARPTDKMIRPRPLRIVPSLLITEPCKDPCWFLALVVETASRHTKVPFHATIPREPPLLLGRRRPAVVILPP